LIGIKGKQSPFLLHIYFLHPEKSMPKKETNGSCFKKQKGRISIMAINFDNTLHQRDRPLKLDNAK